MPAAIYLAPLWLAGCPRPCVGAGCAELYPAAEVHRVSGDTLGGALLVGEGVPLVAGAADAGYDWDLAVDEGLLRAGMPGPGEVRWYGADGASTGSLAGEVGSAYGAQVARAGTALLVGAPLGADGRGLVVWEGEGETVELPGVAAGDRLGSRLVACADLDADGVEDWAVTAAWGESAGLGLAGDVYVSLSGTAPAATDASGLLRLQGTAVGQGFGQELWCGGSFDGDRRADLLVGAPYAAPADASADRGTVGLWRGSRIQALGAPDLVLEGAEDGDRLGSAIAVGDLDADGLLDLAVGAPGHDGAAAGEGTEAGAVYVFLGASLAAVLGGGGDGGPRWVEDRRIEGVYARERAGSTLRIADLDGDGVEDLLVGAPGLVAGDDPDVVQAGAVYVFRGGADAWPPVQEVGDAWATLQGSRQYQRVGDRFTVGDLEGDGVQDVLVLVRAPEPETSR